MQLSYRFTVAFCKGSTAHPAVTSQHSPSSSAPHAAQCSFSFFALTRSVLPRSQPQMLGLLLLTTAMQENLYEQISFLLLLVGASIAAFKKPLSSSCHATMFAALRTSNCPSSRHPATFPCRAHRLQRILNSFIGLLLRR